jgi:hypothetical protein
MALRLLAHFLDEPVATSFSRALRIHGGTVSTYPQAISWFLLTYASEASVSVKQREIALLTRQPNETVQEFSGRLQFEASMLGDLISDRSLRSHFYAGLDKATSMLAQSVLSPGMPAQSFQEAVAHAKRVDQSVSLLKPVGVSHRSHPPAPKVTAPTGRGIFAIPPAQTESASSADDESDFDVEHGVYAIRETRPGDRDIRSYYCFVCWRQGHFATECPLLSEQERKEIAARKAAVLGMMKNKPGWRDRSGRVVPNLPYVDNNRQPPSLSKNL